MSRILELPLQGDARYIDELFLIAKAAISHNPVRESLARRSIQSTSLEPLGSGGGNAFERTVKGFEDVPTRRA